MGVKGGTIDNDVAGHESKQRMWQPSSHHITATLKVSPEGTQDGNKKDQPFSSHLLQRSQMGHPEETEDEKAQDTDPES